MAFSPGYVATVSFNGTDLSPYCKSVKSRPTRQDFKLPVLGGGQVRRMVGPTECEYDLELYLDPVVTGLFNAKMSETTPTTGTFTFAPQGAGGSSESCVVFVANFEKTSAAEGPGTATAKLISDGTVTLG